MSLLLRTLLEHKKQDKIPIWFMRQAGRHLPEYREKMKDEKNFLKVCYNTELVEELTLQPIIKYDLDAAIIFSDIMVVPDALGFNVEFIIGHGPKVYYDENIKTFSSHCLEKLNPIFRSIQCVRKSLNPSKSLIGFSGAPWTLATYILGKEKKISDILDMHRSGDKKIAELIDMLTNFITLYLEQQIICGVDVIQIFDSNANGIPCDLFDDFIIAPTKKIVSQLKSKYKNVGVIGFPKGAGVRYCDYGDLTGVCAVSVDYTISPDWILKNINGCVQGNLCPFTLAHNSDLAVEFSSRIVQKLKNKPLIFNLGHGVLPHTPVDNVQRVVDFVRSQE